MVENLELIGACGAGKNTKNDARGIAGCVDATGLAPASSLVKGRNVTTYTTRPRPLVQ